MTNRCIIHLLGCSAPHHLSTSYKFNLFAAISADGMCSFISATESKRGEIQWISNIRFYGIITIIIWVAPNIIFVVNFQKKTLTKIPSESSNRIETKHFENPLVRGLQFQMRYLAFVSPSQPNHLIFLDNFLPMNIDCYRF